MVEAYTYDSGAAAVAPAEGDGGGDDGVASVMGEDGAAPAAVAAAVYVSRSELTSECDCGMSLAMNSAVASVYTTPGAVASTTRPVSVTFLAPDRLTSTPATAASTYTVVPAGSGRRKLTFRFAVKPVRLRVGGWWVGGWVGMVC